MYYLAKVQYPDLPPSELTKHADAALEKGLHRDKKWLAQVDESLKTEVKLVRVCCFAKNPRNMMMWANYAKNHTGVVMQFRTSNLFDQATGEFRGRDVTYASSALGIREYVHALESGYEHDDPLQMAYIIYGTKTLDWERENELRFFSDRERPYVSFDESALSGVILGAKCSERLIRRFMDSLERWKKPPHVFKVSTKKSSHKLWIQKYRDTQPSP